MEKICWQITVAAFMQPLQYDLRDPAAKDNSITNAASSTKQPWRSHYNAICRDWVAKHNRTTRNGVGNCSSKTGWISTPKRKKHDFEALFKRIFRRKITSAKMEKICWQITVAAFMQPLQDDFRDPAAKDNSITNAATARSNLDAAITMRSAETELQSTIELTRNGVRNCSSKTGGSRRQSEKKTILKHFLKGFLEGKSLAAKMEKICWQITVAAFMQPLQYDLYEVQLQNPTIVLPMQPQHEATLTQPFTLRERSYSCKAQWNSIGNSSTSNTCNPIYIAGTILELQITMEFHRQLIHQHHLQSHLQCGNDPTVANHNGILSTAHARKTGETPFTMRNRSENDPPMMRPWSDHTRDRLATVAPQR